MLRLPGELRTAIYDLVLREPREISVSPHITKPPALLATCRQIRYEASGIWASGNTFYFPIVFSDARWFLAWQKHFIKYRTTAKPENARCTFGGRPNWQNIKSCCKALFDMGVKTDPIQLPNEPSGTIFISAVKITCSCVKSGKSWAETDLLLTYMYRAFRSIPIVGLT